MKRLWSLIAYSDTTPTRFMLALAATSWCILLAVPGDTFDRPVYKYMALVAGDHAEAKWCIFWGLHSAGMWWRTFSARPSLYWALAINSLGLALFGSAAISILTALTYPLPAAVAADFVMAAAAFWVLVRTHINSEHGWRID